jgi:uncharacterized protein YutE (UPF0331/DUF86 family)
MVDPERLHRILRRVTDDVAVLHGYARKPAHDVRADAAALGHVKYLFVTALEGCVDAAQHVCASEGYGPPETNADAMRVLARHGLLTDDLADRMVSAVGFRNVLVHGYVEVEDRRVVSYLQELGDIESFVVALARLLEEEQ